jgi:hypothetical protein
MKISHSNLDKYLFLNDSSYCTFIGASQENNDTIVTIQKYIAPSDYFSDPINSTYLGIVQVDERYVNEFLRINVLEVCGKCFGIPNIENKEKLVFYPMSPIQ